MEERVYHQSRAKLISNIIIDVILMVIFIGWILLIYHLISYYRSKLILTATGIVLKKGFLSVSTIEVPYSKINSVSVQIGILGNIFGYGDVLIQTGNDVSGIPFNGLQDPKEVKDVVMSRVHPSSGAREADNKSQNTHSNKYEELEELSSLLEKGILTQEEFDAKKKQLLNL